MAKSFLAGQGGNTGNKKPKKSGKQLPWKKIGLASGILILAFALGVGAFLLQNGFNGNTGDQTQEESKVSPEDIKPEGAIEESVALSLKGDYDAAQKRLEEEIKTSDNKERSQELVIQQSFNAYNAEKYEESLRYGQEAIEIENNKEANLVSAYAAEAAGQLELAENYYRAALEKIDPNDRRFDRQRQDLEEAIERVSQ